MVHSPYSRKTRFAALALVICALHNSAHAALLGALDPCDASSGLQCRLNNILTLLYGISVVLGVVLVIVIIVAIRSYLRLRKSRKLLP